MSLVYEAADCSGPAAQSFYVELYLTRYILCHNFFANLHQRLVEKGLFEAAERVQVNTARTPAIEQDVLQQVQEAPSTSTRSLAQAVRVFRSRICLREHNMHPFQAQYVQALQPDDYALHIAFAQWYLGNCASDPFFLATVLFSDETFFTREEIINTHNTHMWVEENQHAARRRAA